MVFFIPQAFVLPTAPPSATPPADASLKTAVHKPPGSRADFLRSAGVIASTAAGAALLPKPSSAEEFTDDVLGFKFQVKCSEKRGDENLPYRRTRYDVYVQQHVNMFIVRRRDACFAAAVPCPCHAWRPDTRAACSA